MTRSREGSRAHFRRAAERLPWGVTSNFRYWGDEETIYAREARGARLWDIDGNAYVDYTLGYGPTILGYRHREVDAAARDGQAVGSVFAVPSERELAVAELIAAMVPTVDMVRFANSGTEALMIALRLGRAYTRRHRYVLVEGGFHGLFDWVMWEAKAARPNDPSGEPPVVPFGAGVPHQLREFFWSTPFNDANRLEDLFRRHGSEVGVLLVEPIIGHCAGIPADPEFLRAARELCTRYGAVLLMDEVKTGFRIARGGAQELYGIEADLCVFSKAMANGYPIAALGGRGELMRRIGPEVVHGGTYSGHPVSLAAAERTLAILKDTDALERAADYGRELQTGLGRILEARDIPHSFAGHPSMAGLFLTDEAPRDYREWQRLDGRLNRTLAQALIDCGVLVNPEAREPWFISAAHDAKCLKETLAAFEAAADAVLSDPRAAPGMGSGA